MISYQPVAKCLSEYRILLGSVIDELESFQINRKALEERLRCMSVVSRRIPAADLDLRSLVVRAYSVWTKASGSPNLEQNQSQLLERYLHANDSGLLMQAKSVSTTALVRVADSLVIMGRRSAILPS